MSVLDNVAYGLRVSGGVARRDAASRRATALARSASPGSASGCRRAVGRPAAARRRGPRAGAGAARCCCSTSRCRNLDARLRRQMREEIRELQQRLGLTVVYVTHDQEEALAVSDRIIVMNAGRHRPGGHARATSTSARRRRSSPASWARPIESRACSAVSTIEPASSRSAGSASSFPIEGLPRVRSTSPSGRRRC